MIDQVAGSMSTAHTMVERLERLATELDEAADAPDAPPIELATQDGRLVRRILDDMTAITASSRRRACERSGGCSTDASRRPSASRLVEVDLDRDCVTFR